MNFIRTHKKLTLLIFSFFVFIIFLGIVFSGGKNINNSTPAPTGVFEVKPGDKRDDVIGKLGQPKNEEKIGSQIIDDFNSNSINRDNQVVFDKESKAQLVKQVITSKDTITTENIIGNYGRNYMILYGSQTQAGVYLYVYPDKGVAMLANLQDNTLFEVWYFNPTTIDNFINNLAPGYFKDINKAPRSGF